MASGILPKYGGHSPRANVPRRFADKWGLAATNGKRVALQPRSAWPPFFADSHREFAREVDKDVVGGGEKDLTQRRTDHEWSYVEVPPSQGRMQKWPGERVSRPLFVSV
jgi:hypothetical protein